MPKAIHDKLEKEADDKGLTGEHKDAYVYGTLEKIEKAKKKHRALQGYLIYQYLLQQNQNRK